MTGESPMGSARTALDRVATNVAVVTTYTNGHPHGSTANVWGEPDNGAMCLITLRRGSISAEAVAGSGRFAANILRADQIDVALRFARREPEPGWRFTGVGFEEQSGCPVLLDSLAVLICTVESRIPFGEYEIFTGKIEDQFLGRSAKPALFYDRHFWSTESSPRKTTDGTSG